MFDDKPVGPEAQQRHSRQILGAPSASLVCAVHCTAA
jgi:hypothetical protein